MSWVCTLTYSICLGFSHPNHFLFFKCSNERWNLTANSDALAISQAHLGYDALQCFTLATTNPPSKNGVKKFIAQPRADALTWNLLLNLDEKQNARPVKDGFATVFIARPRYPAFLVTDGSALLDEINNGTADLVIYEPTTKAMCLATNQVESYLEGINEDTSNGHVNMKRKYAITYSNKDFTIGILNNQLKSKLLPYSPFVSKYRLF